VKCKLRKPNIPKWTLFITLVLCILITSKSNNVMATTVLPSRLWIETPSSYQTFNETSFDIKGWSLNAAGIKEIKMYIDNIYIANATCGIYRADVNAVFPGYINGNKSGFTYHIDINTIKAGTHIISVCSYGNDGTIQKKNVNVTINKKPVRGWIESPINNQVVGGYNFNVRGWSLNPSGVATIAIYIDNKFINYAGYGRDRTDVNTAFPGYPNGDKSGYSYDVDIKPISSGIHKLSVVSVGKDGSRMQIDRTIIINRKNPRMCVETPINNFTTTQRDINISGWVLNDSGIKEIQYYLNGKLVGTSSDGITRNDVAAAFPGYSNGSQSGFSFSFNALQLVPVGTQNANVKVIAIGNDGTSLKIVRNLILNKLPERLWIETPLNNDIIKNNINIAGWALNASGVRTVNIYLDNIFKGNGVYGGERRDVDAAFPGYTNGSKSGINYKLDITKISPGNHTIRVEMVGNDGRIISRNIAIKIYGIVEYQNYNRSIDNMVSTQLSSGAVYQNTTTWTWDPANSSMVKQYVDPANIINDEYRKYEFLKLSYNEGASVIDLNNVLNGRGILNGRGQEFLNSAKANNINPIYLISHAILETGSGTSALSKGIEVSSVDGIDVPPKVVYNLFGIGAFDSNPNKYGSEYAYKQGWFSIEQAISGGAYFISKGYINNTSTNQNTLYKMRWNPANPGTHQYATDVRWAYNQIFNIKKLVESCPNSVIYFDIPVFN
jgi:beta-N-acetylglucosaminidase